MEEIYNDMGLLGSDWSHYRRRRSGYRNLDAEQELQSELDC
jgi:hypothetical protein